MSRFLSRRILLRLSFLPILFFSFGAFANSDRITESVFSESLESLLDLEIETAKRKLDPLSLTPAAAQVITRKDIERSGSTSIPQVLRLVPGIEVGQVSPDVWSVSSRGFSGRYSNKLLVLVDGRSIYHAVYNGVYWGMHDIPLSEVERIEVIRGPGASLWGSNAVNGVINVITQHSAAKTGSGARLDLGNKRSSLGLHWADSIASDAHLSLLARLTAFDKYRLEDLSGNVPFAGSLDSGYDQGLFRMRLDWNTDSTDQVSIQFHGQTHRSDIAGIVVQEAYESPEILDQNNDSRHNTSALSLEWQRTVSPEELLKLNFNFQYLDLDSYLYVETNEITQFDFQHALSGLGRHSIVWGFGGKTSGVRVRSESSEFIAEKQKHRLSVIHAFVQDEVELVPNHLKLLFGSKLDHHYVTGNEWQPQIRVLWTPDTRKTIWASVAKASRTPAVLERNWDVLASHVDATSQQNPLGRDINVYLLGSELFESEEVTAFELGFRSQLTPKFAVDGAIYLNEYDKLSDGKLHSFDLSTDPVTVNTLTNNAIHGQTKGLEILADWQVFPQWNARFTFNRILYDLSSDNGLLAGQIDTSNQYSNYGPSRQAALKLAWTPSDSVQVDLWLRYVSEVPRTLSNSEKSLIDSYTELDLRFAWQLNEQTRLSLVGQNLLDKEHAEYVSENQLVINMVPRSFYASVVHEF